MVRQEFPPDRFPQVRLHRYETSKGPTARRNEAASLATTPFLFTIDDDCVVPSPQSFQQALDAFDHPRIAAVKLPFINVNQDSVVHFAAPGRDGRYVICMYYGGMVVFRRDAYLALNGYRTFYFIQFEEPDLSIRFLDRGYVVRLGWSDPIHHLESPSRNRKGRHVIGPRNAILFEWYNTPMPELLLRLPTVSAAMISLMIKLGYPHLGVWGVLRGYAGIVHELNRRQPVTRQTYRLGRTLRTQPLRFEQIEHLLPPIQPADKHRLIHKI
jgi:glycosyltransferase involved in cell wall biosynthesis